MDKQPHWIQWSDSTEKAKKKSDSNLILGKENYNKLLLLRKIMYFPKPNTYSNTNTFKISYWNPKENAGLYTRWGAYIISEDYLQCYKQIKMFPLSHTQKNNNQN